MKKAVRLVALTGALTTVCWFSTPAAQGVDIKPPCTANAPCVTDWDCVTEGIRGLCKYGHCICP